MARKYRKKEFGDRVGGTLRNTTWSWVTVNETEGVAYFLGWRHRLDWQRAHYPMRDVRNTEPETAQDSFFYPRSDNRNGGAEWQKVLDRVLDGELEPRLAICKAVDENAERKVISHVAAFYFTGRIVNVDDALWFEIDQRVNI